MTGDADINQLHIEVDDRCFKLLALQQPMAVDLRAIVGGREDQQRARARGRPRGEHRRSRDACAAVPPVKELIDIPRMALIAQEMLRDALDAYVRRDTVLAQRVLTRDDELDLLKTLVFRELLGMMLKDQSIIKASIDLILISRHLERTGDHATNIAEDVIFMVSARDVRHHA